MKNLFIKAAVFALIILQGQSIWAQVSGISYTVSPTVERVWWDDRAGFADNFLVGGKLGFGFGQNFELRGSYMQSLDQKTSFDGFEIPGYVDSLFMGRDVEMTRWGGEMKLNLSRGKLLPYITAGTGIQSIQLDTFNANKQIYLSVGAGIVLSVGDRLTLQLEGKNTAYRYNTISNLMTEQDKAVYNINDVDFGLEELRNWSALASIQLYLGGRRPGKMTELDKAYMNNFANGYKGLSLTVEPTVGQINWDDNLPYRETRYAGGSAGFDFGPYVGLRAFYWQGLDEDELTERDDIAIYGGEVRTQLNAGTGLIPYLILGGGLIDIDEDNYVGKSTILADSTTFVFAAEDKPFAMGGVGLSIPFGRGFKVFGSAKAMLTSGAPLDDLNEPSEIQTSFNYSAGVLLALGRKAKTNKLLDIEKEAAVSAAQSENDKQAAMLKKEYEHRIADLETKLDAALEANDDEKAAAIMDEKDEAEAVVEELSRREKRKAKRQTENIANDEVVAPTPSVQTTTDASQSVIRMTPGEFENLIEEILESVNQQPQPMPWMLQDEIIMDVEEIDENINNTTTKRKKGKKGKGVDAQLDNLKRSQGNYGNVSEEQKAVNDQMLEILESMNKKLEAKDDQIEQLEKEMKKARKERVQAEKKNRKRENKEDKSSMKAEKEKNRVKLADRDYDEKFIDDSHTAVVQDELKEESFFRKMKYQGTSGFAGLNLGGSNTFNLGLRWHYDININDKFSLELMPETFFGVGSDNTFGISANVLYPIIIDKLGPVKPYIGVGVGAARIQQENDTRLRGATNILIGSYLTVGKGRLYVDLTGRNLFQNNQLVAGYRFPF